MHKPEHLGYRPELDAVRGVAVLLVLAHHLPHIVPGSAYLVGGWLGVDLFFVLSGFLITTLLLEEQLQHGRISLPRFYARRSLRLFPPLAALLTCYLVWAAVQPHRAPEILPRVWMACYWTNWAVAIWHLEPQELFHTWSLSVEEQFYLVFPPILISLLWGSRAGKVPIGRLYTGLSLLLLTALFWRLWLFDQMVGPLRIYIGTDTRADSLLAGALAAVFRLQGRTLWPRLSLLPLLLVPAVLWLPSADPTMQRAGYTIFAGVIAILLLALLERRPTIPHWLLWIGKRSYGIYLYHWALFALATTYLPGGWALLLAPAGAVLVAELSYRWIEQPALRYKSRFAAG